MILPDSLRRRLFLSPVARALGRASSSALALTLVLALGAAGAAAAPPARAAAKSSASAPLPLDSPRVNARALALLKKLSLQEKILLLSGYDNMFTHPIPAYDIPALKMSDASVGVRVWGPSTAYPASAALAAGWDPALAAREGRSLGRDARARGVYAVLGPGLDIVREPQNGRNFEYLGEDPDLAGALGAAWIRGLQAQGVAAVPKHYAGNEQETNRGSIQTIVSRRALEEIYLPPFRDAIEQGHAMFIMSAYNRLNGPFCSASPYLLTTMLRQQWGFKGAVISDWGGTHATLASLLAGLDLEMPSDQYYNARAIMPLLGSGQLSRANIDQHVLRLLRVMVAMRFLDRPQLERSIPLVDPTSAATALQVETEGAVLLKNQNHMLPLARARTRRIVLVGPDAATAVTGGGGSAYTTPNIKPVTLEAAVRAAAGPGATVTVLPYPLAVAGPHMWPPPRPHSYAALPPLSAADQAAIQSADVVIACVGTRESEGVDRDFHLPAHQDEYLSAVAALNPRTVVVLNAGGAVAMPWIDSVAGLLDAWYPGENGNTAVAGILFGRVNPSGHLPDTFEKHWSDSPAFGHYPGHDDQVTFAEGVQVGYRWYDTRHIAPLFPFGFGLSYTTFSIHGLRVASQGAGRTRVITVTAAVTNTGRRSGADVAQLYVRPPQDGAVERTFQQLRGFQRVELKPGETKLVRLQLHWRDFAYYDTPAHAWRTPAGDYAVALGDSSRNLAQTAPVVWSQAVEFVQSHMPPQPAAPPAPTPQPPAADKTAATVRASSAAPAYSIGGVWDLLASVGGNTYPSTCTLTQTGAAITGSCQSEQGTSPLSGVEHGHAVTFNVTASMNGTALTIIYSGRLSAADQMKGTLLVQPFQADGDFTAHKHS